MKLLLASAGMMLIVPAVAAEAPVREVVLYKNGVGYFLRQGVVARGESIRLDFRAEEMNDVLKSLMVRDTAGAAVSGVRYDSADPLEKKLREFPFEIRAGAPLASILDQFRGARLEWPNASATLVGARVIRNEKGEERESMTVIGDDGQIRAVDLAGIPPVKFADPAVQRQFRDYLAILAAARSRDRKSLFIDSTSAADRTLQLSYLTPVPVWKSAYRLVLSKGGSKPEAALEGWAIVDNTSGEDWANVRLSLVSGRPVSFQSRLYAPRYVERPFADVAAAGQDRPETYDSALATVAAPPAPGAGALRGVVGGVPGGVPKDKLGGVAESQRSAVMIGAARGSSLDVAAAVEVADQGVLFQYRFAQPVTVQRNGSALLPFLAAALPARPLLIWTSGVHPRQALELTNDSGQTLDGGPVTVFEAGAYHGEALMETVRPQEKRLISYALDTGVRVDAQVKDGWQVKRKLSLARGMLDVVTYERRSTEYAIRNADAAAKSLWIEHPIDPGAKLVSPSAPERTARSYRFSIPLTASAAAALSVVEERSWSESITVSSLTPDDIVQRIEDTEELPAAARKALEEIAAKKRQIAAQERELSMLREEFARREADQVRLRENLKSLGAVPGQDSFVQQYARQVADLEAALSALRARDLAGAQRLDTLERELSGLLERLTF